MVGTMVAGTVLDVVVGTMVGGTGWDVVAGSGG